MKRIKAFTTTDVLLLLSLAVTFPFIMYTGINPARNYAEVRNQQRSSDVQQILNAIWQYNSEEGHDLSDFGIIPFCTTSPAAVISTVTVPGTINLETKLVDTYLIKIPKDPTMGTDRDTGYTICKTTTGRVQISAPHAENGKTIIVKK